MALEGLGRNARPVRAYQRYKHTEKAGIAWT